MWERWDGPRCGGYFINLKYTIALLCRGKDQLVELCNSDIQTGHELFWRHKNCPPKYEPHWQYKGNKWKDKCIYK